MSYWLLSTECIAIEINFKRPLDWPYGFGTIVPFRTRPIVSCTLPYSRYQALRMLKQEPTQWSFLSENKIIAVLISGNNIIGWRMSNIIVSYIQRISIIFFNTKTKFNNSFFFKVLLKYATFNPRDFNLYF